MFHFALEVVLKVRRSRERREWLRLALLNQQAERIRQEWEQVEGERRAMRAHEAESLIRGAMGAELRFWTLCAEALQEQSLQLRQQLAEARAQCQAQRERYQTERRNREMLETLEAHDYQRWQQQQARRNQATLDEMFLMQHPPSNPSSPGQ